MHYVFPVLVMFMLAVKANAAVRTELIEYKIGDVTLEGYLAYDDTIKGIRPGVLVIHEWWGINDYIKRRTEQIAQLGYVAFAADIYGKGNRAKTRQEAMALAGRFRSGSDRSLLRARANAGLEALRKKSLVDPKHIAAIGYCFGGTTVLELARSGADIAGVVSFHGGLATPNPDDAKNIKAKVVVLTGADDPSVKAEEVGAFEDEMDKAGVDWYLVRYSNSVHGFTNPENGNDNAKGVAYNEKADKRSWQAMRDFFEEIFK
ncbi:MAG TPA: dienelactone hydrolase family protein [Nitrospirota bacterium]|nr:dienelactone hydrolase family protein [Nitrospirota bacterium]